MKSKKATKRALLSSALSLVLCFSMLLGTTFAWFYDTAETAVNTIQSGKLDVDIVDVNGDSLDEKTMKFVKAKGASADEEFLWEPGCTYVTEGFQIENLGNLWLKYQLVINGIDGDSDLLDVIDFWITDNNESLEKAVELGTYLDDLAPKTKSGVYYLVGHMDENAENEYQGLTIEGIGITVYATQKDAEYDSFGPDYDADAVHPEIRFFNSYGLDKESDLLAFAPTAGDAASSGLSLTDDGKAQIDAPGAWYTIDADLAANEYIVEYDIDITDVTVGENVTVDTGDQGTWKSTPIMLERGSTKVYYGTSKNEYLGTLEGTKVHVAHTYSYNSENELVIATTVSDGVDTVTYSKAVASAAKTTLYWDIYYATDAGKATMDNFTVKGIAPVVDSGAELAAVLAEGGKVVLGTDIALTEAIEIPEGVTATLDLNGKTITGNFTKAEGPVLTNNGTLTITGGTVESTATNGSDAIYNTGILTLNKVNVVGAPSDTATGTASYALNTAGENAQVTITDSNISGRGAIGATNGTKVVINGGTYHTPAVAWGHAVYAVDEGTEVTINGGTFSEGYEMSANNWGMYQIYSGNKAKVTVNGGDFSQTWDCANGYDLCTANEGVIVVKGGTFAENPASQNSINYVADGYHAVESNGKYYVVSEQVTGIVSTPADLVALGGKSLEGTYVLTADIDLNGAAMPTIGAAYGKSLTIDGNGHTISNATTAHTNHNGMKHHGFFYAYTNSTLNISDLTFDNIVIDATKDTERNYGAAVVVAFADGGSTVNLTNVDVHNSKVLNNTPDIGDEAGVYVGYQTGTLNMVDCDSTGCEVVGETAEKTGAFIGMVNGTATLTDCTTDLTIGACNRVSGTLNVGSYAEENGVTLYNDAITGEKVLYLVPADYAEDTVIVPEGVTTIGNYAFAYNSNVKEVVLASTVRDLGRGFDGSTVEKVVLNEGLTTIGSRAFRSTTALKEVVIPSTVTVIEDNAFQKSGIKSITIPATVQTIGETAFGASLIEEVTFAGNTSIQGYAFRGCTKLNKVTLNGDDVTFIASTLNGRNSMWFCNGESNNPNTSDIDFYVVNNTVAARVKTAMGAEAGNTDVYVNGVKYEG